ncbi:MAG: bile acid:sodium symporter family protein [Caulobacteraceae bacterium]
MLSSLARLRPDNFTLSLIATVILASVLPCHGGVKPVFADVTNLAIALLFFLHGAKLSRQAIVQGAGHWRLHLTVMASSFVLFPALGLAVRFLPATLISPQITAGLLYMTLLPSTVQSSIAFTSVAGGNVPAAVCSASASNLIGIFLTPVLAAVFMGAHGRSGNELQAVEGVALQLLVPFLAGHFSRPLIGKWVDSHKKVLGFVDRGSILLVVYTAFSAAVVEGLWHKLSGVDLITVLVADAAILGVALVITTFAARALGFSKEDEITIVFCGSKKSLASGVPMAGVLFPAAQVGVLIVPLMLFHQIQLMVCAVIARRYAAQQAATTPAPARGLELAKP